jgi:hypothetical protein
MQQFAFIVLQLTISLLNRLITWLNMRMYIQPIVCLSVAMYNRLVNSEINSLIGSVIRFVAQTVSSNFLSGNTQNGVYFPIFRRVAAVGI